MSELREEIDTFERTHLMVLQNWSAMVGVEDLEVLIETLGRVRKQSEQITARFCPADKELYQQRWSPILDRINCAVTTLLQQMEELKKRTRGQLNQLQKVSKGLKGYRQSDPAHTTLYESEG